MKPIKQRRYQLIDRRSITLGRIIIWSFFFVALVVSIFAIITLNNKISDSEEFHEQVITDRYEGSLSENLGFQIMLTAEITRFPDVKAEIEDQGKNEVIIRYLEYLRAYIKGLELPGEPITINGEANIETVNPDELKSWLRPETLAQITYRHLNLESSDTN